MTSRNWSNSIC